MYSESRLRALSSVVSKELNLVDDTCAEFVLINLDERKGKVYALSS